MLTSPVQIGDGVWWVGATLDDDRFQCHAYLVVDGDDCILLDPGSPLTLDSTLSKVADVASLESIRWIVCHHADPDVCAALAPLSRLLKRDDVTVVTEWRAAALLKHYGHRFGYYLNEDHDWALTLPSGRALQFQLTPYLHFPGAFTTFDPLSGVLFSSDLFGGFVPDSDVLISDDIDFIVEQAGPFHQHYMPTSDLLQAGIRRLQRRFPTITRIAPQHGHVIDAAAVGPVMDAVQRLDCGVFALADADLDLKRLVRLSQAGRRLDEAISTSRDLPALTAAVDHIVRQTGLAAGCSLGVGEGAEPADAHHGVASIAGDPALHVRVKEPVDATAAEELIAMIGDAADRLRQAFAAHLSTETQAAQIARLRQTNVTDPLTGLLNRRALQQSPPIGDYALLALDLDHFKAVNDNHGHATGDEVLRAVATCLEQTVRQGDQIYRVGGEELLVVLPRTDTATALQIAERIRTSVEAIDLTGSAPGGRITVSIGVTAVTNDESPFAQAVEDADALLYAAKTSGRNRVVAASRPSPAADPPSGS